MKKKIVTIIQAMILTISVQGCWAGDGEAHKDIKQVESEKKTVSDGNDYSDVCNFLLEKKKENTLKTIFERTKALKPGMFMFDISKYVESGEGKAVIAESVQGAKFNLYMALSEVKLKENGLLDKSTILSDQIIEFADAVEFFFYQNAPYVLTKLSGLESDVNKNVYMLSNSNFELACK